MAAMIRTAGQHVVQRRLPALLAAGRIVPQRQCSSAGPEKTVDKRVYRPMDETFQLHLNAAHFYRLLRSHGTTSFFGVPDSLLKDFCAYITDNVSSEEHIIAVNEGTALAHAAGHHMATGKIACVYLQNSGLGNTVNPLLSMCSSKVYSIPTLLLIGWRGEPGKKDEPQHLLQGELTPGLLKEMGVPFEILPDHAEGCFKVLETAYKHMEETKSPFAVLVRKDTFEKYSLKTEAEVFTGDNMLHREEILEEVISVFPKDPLVTTTGFTSREMFELREQLGQSHAHDFLTVGSMGHCSSIALGIAMAKAKTAEQVLCIDGDGAALMHMGAFATAGQSGLHNYKHILVNNAIHDSVGGQPTGCNRIDFPAIAAACGYKSSACVSSKDDIKAALETLRQQDGPAFLEIRSLPGARADLGRPTTTAIQNKEDFMDMLINGPKVEA
jgi:phosphonopyruvate decarboxylase